jgi:hypothetical protein
MSVAAVVRSFGIPLLARPNDGVVQLRDDICNRDGVRLGQGGSRLGVPTISCINVGPVPQALGHSRAMWYLAKHSFDRHT